jgi:hypothetical protein
MNKHRKSDTDSLYTVATGAPLHSDSSFVLLQVWREEYGAVVDCFTLLTRVVLASHPATHCMRMGFLGGGFLFFFFLREHFLSIG